MQTMKRVMRGVLVMCVGAWTAGCGDDGGDTVSTTEQPTSSPLTTTGTTGPDVPTSTTSDDTTTDPAPTTEDVDPTTSTTDPTTEDPTTGDSTTGGVTGMCDPQAQDCPAGFKCTAYALEPGDEWNANKCIEEPIEGGVSGDPCTVDGEDIFSGLDDCAKGYVCLNADPETKQGICTEFCAADDTCPNTVNGGLCVQANDGFLPICLQLCDPLVQDCPGEQGCYGDVSGPPFFCFNPDPQGNEGAEGDDCAFTNACVGGLHCAPGSALEGCNAMMCCTSFCDIQEMTCDGAEECTPFFPTPQVGFENVGICALPG